MADARVCVARNKGGAKSRGRQVGGGVKAADQRGTKRVS